MRRPPIRVGPADPIDHGGSGVIPGSYWPLQLTCQSHAPLSSIPSEWTEWLEGPLTESHAGGQRYSAGQLTLV